MYSVVLMAALTAGGEAPQCWFHHGCHSCASSCSGCHGGCYGGGFNSCSGGCYGGYSGCYGGGCFGCAGTYSGYSGGWGSCYGGCWGGGYGCHGCYGCYGCYGCTGWSPGGSMPGTGAQIMPSVPAEVAPPPLKINGSTTLAPTKAKLVVEVPADAKVYIDDQLMKTTSTHRVFNTPPLERGQTYYYEVRVEVMRDGQVFKDTKRVLVRTGEELRESFADLGRRDTGTATADARK